MQFSHHVCIKCCSSTHMHCMIRIMTTQRVTHGHLVLISHHKGEGAVSHYLFKGRQTYYISITLKKPGAGRSSEEECSLMVRWVVGSILHGVDPLSYFLFQPVLHDWCNKGRGMCYPVCGMGHIKKSLLLIGKSSLCGGSRFPFSLSELSLTICLTPYNHR